MALDVSSQVFLTLWCKCLSCLSFPLPSLHVPHLPSLPFQHTDTHTGHEYTYRLHTRDGRRRVCLPCANGNTSQTSHAVAQLRGGLHTPLKSMNKFSCQTCGGRFCVRSCVNVCVIISSGSIQSASLSHLTVRSLPPRSLACSLLCDSMTHSPCGIARVRF